ncbi:MAG: TRAM domain-containing protein [Nanoarchaeota archaeon]
MMHDRPFMRKSFAPVRVGDVVDLTIEAVGEKGDGVAKVKGFVIFVPKAKQGETVKVKITRVLQKVGFGEIVGAEGAAAESSGEEGQESESSEARSEVIDEEGSDDASSDYKDDEGQDREDF